MSPLLIIVVFLTAATAVACSPPFTNISCPPFHSMQTSFPFSNIRGCGHPDFQIRCAEPHSDVYVGQTQFSILAIGPTSAVLSPILTNQSKPATCQSLPLAPLNISPSPLHPSAAACRALSALRPCRRTSNDTGNCTFTPWQRRLISHPHNLFVECSTAIVAASCLNNSSPSSSASAIIDLLSNGILFEWDPSTDSYYNNCSSCRQSSGGVCGFNDSAEGKPFVCFNNSSRIRIGAADRRQLLVVAAVLFSAASACVLLLLLAFWGIAALCRHRRTYDPTAAVLLRHHHLQHPVYTYDQLRDATGGFDPDRKIGDGGFGSVYLACLDDSHVAAVKRLHRHHPTEAATKSFCNEVLILSSLRHQNLVRLHGYCCDPRGLLLVYDYVPNGTLADHLHSAGTGCRKPALNWVVRVDVAVQTAAAMEYLHFALKPPVVHRDITSTNIFVERDMRVKLGDFGLSRLLTVPDSNSGSGLPKEYVCCTGPQGTPGYLDPEYHRSFQLTEKSDVYSFGVVLLELVTGMKAVDVRRDRSEVALVDLVMAKIHVGALHQVIDPVLFNEGKEVMVLVEAMAELAFRCVAADKDDRPDARELGMELKRIRSLIDGTRKES